MPAALLAALLLQTADPTMAELENAYDQTCNSRIYGQFDDMCSAMADRLKAYRAELRKRPRTTAPPPPLPALPAPPASTPPLVAATPHAPLATAPPGG